MNLTRNFRRARALVLASRIVRDVRGSLYPEWDKELKLFPNAAISEKYLLGKAGSDSVHVAVVAAQADEPAYVIEDSTLRAGVTVLDFPITCYPLGLGRKLPWVLAAGPINDGDDLVSKGDGGVLSLQDAGTAAGTYWKVGIARGDSALGGTYPTDGVQFISCVPVQVTK